MKKFCKAIWEHLKTKRKYNTLMIKYEMTKEELEKKQVELNTQRRIFLKKQETWENTLDEQEEEIIDLKKKISDLKKKSKKVEK